ncbi:MAG TPA: mechanosensitive ion channel family protein [Gemmatimonadota bacterium]|nr:mechanosensitive ion channel family protein [Gemmatimonadota bacterium]
MNLNLLEQLVSGSGLLYVALGLLALATLVVRGLSADPHVRRRALLVFWLLIAFAVLQVALSAIPQWTSGLLTTPQGELVPGLVENPTYRYGSVILLLFGLFAALMAFTLFVVDYLLAARLGWEVPAILRDVALVTAFFTGSLIILSQRTELNPTSIFTTAGVVSIVIGLALQDTLGNLFSGLALQTERSFNVGDWVGFGEREGVVTDISWRTTKLRTRSNDLVIIPNSIISKDVVINYSAPTRLHAELAHVGAHYRHPPADVVRALEEAADQTPGILDRPAVDIRTKEYGDSSVVYEIKYWMKDYALAPDISDEFMTRIWYAFKRRGIEIPFPIRNVYLREVTPETERAEAEADDERIFQHLRRAELFDALSDDEARALAALARVEPFFEGETILRQGEPGDSLYIVDEGRVEVVVSHNERSERVAELGPSAFMGEMALLTGDERRATVVALEATHCFVIDRESIRGILQRNPGIAERMSEILARRTAELEASQAVLERRAAEAPSEDKRQILGRIRDFFGFGPTPER